MNTKYTIRAMRMPILRGRAQDMRDGYRYPTWKRVITMTYGGRGIAMTNPFYVPTFEK